MERLIEILSSTSSWIGQTTVQAALLVVLILSIQYLLGHRLPGRWRFALWLLLVARLSLPGLPRSPWSLYNLLPERQVITESALGGSSAGRIRLDYHGPQELLNESAKDSSSSPVISTTDGEVSQGLWDHLRLGLAVAGSTHLLLGIWLTGVFILLAHSVVESLRFWWLVKRRRPVTDSTILDLLEDCKEQMGVQTIIGIVVADRIKSPALFGFIRPRLLVPSGLLEQLSHEQLRFIFLHELGHLRRHDVLLGWLCCLLQALHWFNPLVWLAFYRMRADREMACDQLALAHVTEAEVSSYGQTIVSLLERFTRRQYMPSLAGLSEHKAQVERRITMIAEYQQEKRKVSIAALTALCLLSVIVLTNAMGESLKTIIADGIFQAEANAESESGRNLAYGEVLFKKGPSGVRAGHAGSSGFCPEPAPYYMVWAQLCQREQRLFQEPITLKSNWVQEGDKGSSVNTTLVGLETVSVAAGTFVDSLKQVAEISGAHEGNAKYNAHVNGVRTMWFAPGVGLVKFVYQHANGVVSEGELIDYTIAGDRESYLPLALGNYWTYRWQNDYRKEAVIETVSFLEAGEENIRKAAARCQRSSVDMQPVEIVSNGEGGTVKMVSTAQKKNGEHLARGAFDIHLPDLEQGSGGTMGRGEGPGSYMLVPFLIRPHQKLFQLPLEDGVSWSQPGDAGSRMETHIAGYETIETVTGSYRCLKQVTQITGAYKNSHTHNAFTNGTRTLWFAPGIGLVKMVYSHDDGTTTVAELIDYNVSGNSQEPWPLDVGNIWTYQWDNEYRSQPVIETVSIPKQGDVVYLWVRDGQTEGDGWRLP